MEAEGRNWQEETIISMAIVVSVFSQIEPISGVMRPLMRIIWIVAAAYCVVVRKFRVELTAFVRHFAFAYLALGVMCFVCSILGTNHLNSNYLSIMLIPLMVSFVASQISETTDERTMSRYAEIYLLASVILGMWANATYFSSYSTWLQQQVYVFSQKNSAGQIWCTAAIMGFALIKPSSMLQKVFWHVCALYVLFMTALSQCRTAMLAMAVVGIVLILTFSEHKFRWFTVVLVLAAALWQVPAVQSFIDKSLFLTKYAGADLNTFSSGRIGLYAKALQSFLRSPFVGVGNYYVDCSYICVLAEDGIIGFILVESVWLHRMILNMSPSYFPVTKRSQQLLVAITVFYIVESVLEGYPPFGPGVSSFMFWILSSILAEQGEAVGHIEGLWGI